MSVQAAAERLARHLEVDEAADLLRWQDDTGARRETGLHDYAALYAVPGLYEAAYLVVLDGGSPRLLAQALADVVPPGERAQRTVLDVGAGSGAVGEALRAVGFGPVSGTDLEPASERALLRDRPEVYRSARTADLAHPTAEDLAWLAEVAPDVVTVAGAVGYGHLPVEALHVLTRLLPERALLALTVAPDLETAPELAAYAALLYGPAYAGVSRRDGVHRRTGDGRELPVTALVLRRTGAAA